MVVKSSVLKELESLYTRPGNQLFVLSGRADSEKELLLKQFLEKKKHFYYRARPASALEQRNRMGAELADKMKTALTKYTYDEYFNRVRSGDPTKLVVVIDEFQHIVKKDGEFIASVLKLKGKRLYPGPVMILLCSSAVAWVDRELGDCIGETAAKKIDETIRIGNLNFLEVVRALPEYPVSECIRVHGVIGGVPGYISRWESGKSLKENLCRLVLREDGYLHGAVEALLKAELRELSVYETILAAIAGGVDKLNDLYLATGFSRAKISVYMKNLSAFGIIQKVVSFETGGWENAKKGIYRICDHYVNFWFHFIYPHLSDFYMMEPEEFYDTRIAPGMDAYLGRYFIEVCMEYMQLLDMVGKLPLSIHKMGTWVGKKGNIDIIAQNGIRQNMVGLCNWDRPQLTMAMCEDLFSNMEKARIKAEHYYLFSAKAFEPAVTELAARDKRFILVDMNQL